MDNRSIGQFKKDLVRGTKYEKIASKILKYHFEEEGRKVEIEDYGMDNSGELVVDAKKVNAKADYIFIIDGEKHYFEIKVHSDKYPCMTFKKSNIQTYLRNSAECIIVTESCFFIFGEKMMRYMIEKCQAKSYPGFASGKSAYRFTKPEISALEIVDIVKKVPWNKNAQEKIKNNSIIFER